MLVSPAEPTALRLLGLTSSIPEDYGADFLLPSSLGLVGVQRKTLTDLIASIRDGRLQKELHQIARLAVAMLILEGTPTWANGQLANGNPGWTRAQHYGVLWRIQQRGVWLVPTSSQDETAEVLGLLSCWISRDHHSLERRPSPPTGAWGTREDEDWSSWLMQGFKDIGPTLARRIVDTFGGPPLAWSVTEKQLRQVEGIGPVMAKRLIGALDAAA